MSHCYVTTYDVCWVSPLQSIVGSYSFVYIHVVHMMYPHTSLGGILWCSFRTKSSMIHFQSICDDKLEPLAWWMMSSDVAHQGTHEQCKGLGLCPQWCLYSNPWNINLHVARFAKNPTSLWCINPKLRMDEEDQINACKVPQLIVFVALCRNVDNMNGKSMLRGMGRGSSDISNQATSTRVAVVRSVPVKDVPLYSCQSTRIVP